MNNFPKIMSGCAGDFACLYSEHTESSKEFYFMSFITLLGTVLADKLTINSEIAQQPRINTILLGSSGEARKSSAADATIKFFKNSMDQFPVCRGIGSAEGLAKKLEENNRITLFFDEMRQLVSKCKIDGSVLLPTLTTLFENNYYENNTKTSTVKIENAYLSILACSTIETFEEIWNSSMSDIGFTNRLLLIPSAPNGNRFPIPKKIPEMEKFKIKTDLFRIVKLANQIREFNFTDQAYEVYADWYNTMERNDYSRRLDTYAMRLMILFAINDYKEIIDAESVLKTICFCDWQLEVRKELTPIDADNATAKMEEKIRRQLQKTKFMTRRDLQQRTNANRMGVWYLDTALANLVRSKEIKFSQTDKTYTYLDCSQNSSQILENKKLKVL